MGLIVQHKNVYGGKQPFKGFFALLWRERLESSNFSLEVVQPFEPSSVLSYSFDLGC